MTNPEGHQEITPYLNPNYWGGHTLGYGEPTDVTPVPYRMSDTRFAKDAVRANVRSNSVTPLHTFYPGDVFDPASFHPGTVVLFRREALRGESALADYSLEELTVQEVPVRATATFPCFGDLSPELYAKSETQHYLSNVRWGVVPRHNDEGYLLNIAAWGVFAKGVGAKALWPFVGMHAPITVGETLHRPKRGQSEESLRRVTIMHLIAYGTPERQRQRRFGFAFRTVFGGTS